MKNLLTWIDRWSFRKIFSLMGITTILLLIPLVWWGAQLRNTIGSRASLEPTLMPTPIIYGDLPTETPTITTIDPYFGKVGDQVVIKGENFGNNPPSSELYLGAVKVTDIQSWVDREIVFTIPSGAISEKLGLVIGPYRVDWPYPFTVYSLDTKVQISLAGDYLAVANPQGVARAELILVGKTEPVSVTLPNNLGNSWLSPERYDGIEWVTLFDTNNQIVSFWIDPLEML